MFETLTDKELIYCLINTIRELIKRQLYVNNATKYLLQTISKRYEQ